jgi:hypothetical protein
MANHQCSRVIHCICRFVPFVHQTLVAPRLYNPECGETTPVTVLVVLSWQLRRLPHRPTVCSRLSLSHKFCSNRCLETKQIAAGNLPAKALTSLGRLAGLLAKKKATLLGRPAPTADARLGMSHSCSKRVTRNLPGCLVRLPHRRVGPFAIRFIGAQHFLGTWCLRYCEGGRQRNSHYGTAQEKFALGFSILRGFIGELRRARRHLNVPLVHQTACGDL